MKESWKRRKSNGADVAEVHQKTFADAITLLSGGQKLVLTKEQATDLKIVCMMVGYMVVPQNDKQKSLFARVAALGDLLPWSAE